MRCLQGTCVESCQKILGDFAEHPVSQKVGDVFGVFQKGLETSNHWFNPLGYLVQQKGSSFYANHPVLARCITVPINAIAGAIKVFAFPAVAVAIMSAKVIPVGLTVAIGACAAPMFALIASAVITMPIIAATKFYQGKPDEGKKWLAAWAFALLAAAGAVGFLFGMVFHLTLLQTSILLVGGIAISIIIHVYRVAKEPPPKALLP